MYFSGKTDVGMKRSVNQDSFTFEKLCSNAFLAVVCDGMGGANGGNIASSLACKTFAESVRAESEKYKDSADHCNITPDCAELILIKSIELANKVVFAQAEKEPELSGMGTTLVAALVIDDTAYIVNVGDSRAYLIFSDIIDRITHDHSYVQFLIDLGELTEEEAQNSTNKNIIMKAIGINNTLDPDSFRVEFGGDAFLLLCSDGLTNFVSEQVIKETVLSFNYEEKISKQDDVDRVCNRLIELANENGGGDNITVALYLHEATGMTREDESNV